MSDSLVKNNPTWKVFRNPDGDQGGWVSYADDGTHYLGGDVHKNKAEAIVFAKSLILRHVSS